MSAGAHLDDRQLSALVDGAAETDDVAHAAACARCHDRLAAWQAASRLVGAAPDPPGAAQRDAAVTAALASFEPHSGPDVVAGREERRRPGRWRSHTVQLVAAIAAVLVIAGVAVGVTRSSGGRGAGGASSTRSASAAGAPPTAGSARESKPESASASASASAANPSAVERPAPVLPRPVLPGPVRSAALVGDLTSATLVPAVQAALARAPGSGSAGANATPRVGFAGCAGRAAAGASLPVGTVPLLEASATYEGSPAGVFVFSAGAHHVAAVVRPTGCQFVAAVTW